MLKCNLRLFTIRIKKEVLSHESQSHETLTKKVIGSHESHHSKIRKISLLKI